MKGVWNDIGDNLWIILWCNIEVIIGIVIRFVYLF